LMEKTVVNLLIQNNINTKSIYISIEKFDSEGNVIGPVLQLFEMGDDF